MDERTLMDFILKIIANTKGNKDKTDNVLHELKRILEAQDAPESLTKIVDKAINSIPEIYEWSHVKIFTSDHVDNAFNRAESRRSEERRRREEANRNHGRC